MAAILSRRVFEIHTQLVLQRARLSRQLPLVGFIKSGGVEAMGGQALPPACRRRNPNERLSAEVEKAQEAYTAIVHRTTERQLMRIIETTGNRFRGVEVKIPFCMSLTAWPFRLSTSVICRTTSQEPRPDSGVSEQSKRCVDEDIYGPTAGFAAC